MPAMLMARGVGWWHGAADTLADSIPMGDFGLWNELRARGHEVMPHGYRHANKRKMPFADAKELILRCLDVSDRELPRGVSRRPRRRLYSGLSGPNPPSTDG
jgi:peptidoglycan/xylan/chitin deacetylase (PgdA/CDA1 family)